jgi:hypothetical protein
MTKIVMGQTLLNQERQDEREMLINDLVPSSPRVTRFIQ